MLRIAQRAARVHEQPFGFVSDSEGDVEADAGCGSGSGIGFLNVLEGAGAHHHRQRTGGIDGVELITERNASPSTLQNPRSGAVRARFGVDAFIRQPQALDGTAGDEVLVDDGFGVFGLYVAVPDSFWIDHDCGPVLALVEA
jgi:hypothetical protein